MDPLLWDAVAPGPYPRTGLPRTSRRGLADLDLDDYDAIVLCGGQSPMLTFRDDAGFIEAVGV
jgi:putative intracellular protease/amidase